VVFAVIFLVAALGAQNAQGFIEFFVLACGACIWVDAARLKLSRLALGQLPLTGYERMKPWEWGVLTMLLFIFVAPVYAVKRNRLWELAEAADQFKPFADNKERKKACSTPGFFPADELADRKARSHIEGWTIALSILALVAVLVVAVISKAQGTGGV
jgi:hypothetical protein